MNKTLREKLEKIKCVYSDIDGTIENTDHVVSDYTINVVNRLKAKGYKFGLISGRANYLSTSEISCLKPTCEYVGSNGNWILDVDGKTTLFFDPINPKFVKVFIDKLVQMGLSFILFSFDRVYYSFEKNDYSRKNLSHNLKIWNKHAIVNFVKYHGPIHNISFSHITVYCPSSKYIIPNELLRIGEDYSIQMIRGSDHCFDACNSRNNKGTGLEFVARRNNLALENILVIGDSYNDIPMLKIAGLPIVMKQADDNIKKYAAAITDFDNNNNGFANLMEKFFLEN